MTLPLLCTFTSVYVNHTTISMLYCSSQAPAVHVRSSDLPRKTLSQSVRTGRLSVPGYPSPSQDYKNCLVIPDDADNFHFAHMGNISEPLRFQSLCSFKNALLESLPTLKFACSHAGFTTPLKETEASTV